MIKFALAYLIVSWWLCAAIAHFATPRRSGLLSAMLSYLAFNVFTLFGFVSIVLGQGIPQALKANSTSEIIIAGTAIFCLLPLLAFVPTKRWPPEPLPGEVIPICPSCRYDLRGNTSGVCPECGQSFEVR